MTQRASISVRLIGGPTALLEYGGLRLLTDPTFDPPGRYEPRPGVEMIKQVGPAITADELPPVDAVLLSHDHHVDNLDGAGRRLLARVPLTLTTRAGAERLGSPAKPLAPWDSHELQRPSGERVLVTAVPAQHGPDGTDHLTGEVTGFYISSVGLPTVYVSGDNASVDVARRIAARLGSAPIALLHTGAAQMPYLGQSYLTLPAARAPKVARVLGAQQVIPIHFDGWAHFSQGATELRAAFEQAELENRLRVPVPEKALEVDLPASLRVALVGASGTVGRALAREALARGHRVTAISRHPVDGESAPGATTTALDATSPELVPALADIDVLVGAVSGRRENRPDEIAVLAGRLLEAAQAAGVPRLLWVGGAGSLEVVPGLREVETPGFPAEIKAEALAQAAALERLRTSTVDVAWSYFSPAAFLDEHGAGGEPYRVAATDALLRDEDGASRIALADYARAALDEIEDPRFSGTRFTIAAQAVAAPALTAMPAAV